MKKKSNPIKPNKKIIKISLFLIILIIVTSIILLASSLLPQKKSSLNQLGYAFGNNSIKAQRRFQVESHEKNIYNLGEYRVNISSENYLTFNLSIKCNQKAFATLQENKILVQNAVIETFSMYGDYYFPDTVSGKEKIKRKIKENISNSLGHPLVTDVYFNKFLIQ